MNIRSSTSPASVRRIELSIVLIVCPVLLFAYCGGGSTDIPIQTPPLPNFVIILADDLGYNDLGSYWTPDPTGRAPRIATPNLDRMAREGMRFTSFYSAAPACTPSRAALMTGSYPQRIGMSKFEGETITGVITPDSTTGLHPGEITLAELLEPRGYASALIGKWHLGRSPQLRPDRQGFDLFVRPVRYSDDRMNAVIQRNREILSDRVDRADFTRHMTEEAVRFIRENQSRPFFLYFSHFLAHVPHAVPDEFRGRSSRGLYGDVVTVLDWSTGRIMETLEEFGLSDRTLVLFTSDNGGLLRAEVGGSNYPFNYGKGATYEGGIRVPCIAWWPGRIPPAETNEMAALMDIFPTFAALAGAVLPDDRIIDGRDIWPLMAGGANATSPHDALFYYRMGRLQAMRSGDWKLHFGKDGSPKWLFDLAGDPGERRNVLRSHPGIVEQLERLAIEMRSEIGDDLSSTEGSNTRPAAVVIDGILQND